MIIQKVEKIIHDYSGIGKIIDMIIQNIMLYYWQCLFRNSNIIDMIIGNRLHFGNDYSGIG